MELYKFEVMAPDNHGKSLKDYEGRVLLIVNTASECGFTPQYEGLQALHTEFSGQGLQILAFPCNQFGQQEPGDNEAIQQFCQLNYQIGFPVFSKLEVNGPAADTLYKYLTKLEPAGDIQWNFTKFLFDRHGHLISRYEPSVTPQSLTAPIAEALNH
jgi:glutathione peroxidase